MQLPSSFDEIGRAFENFENDIKRAELFNLERDGQLRDLQIQLFNNEKYAEKLLHENKQNQIKIKRLQDLVNESKEETKRQVQIANECLHNLQPLIQCQNDLKLCQTENSKLLHRSTINLNTLDNYRAAESSQRKRQRPQYQMQEPQEYQDPDQIAHQINLERQSMRYEQPFYSHLNSNSGEPYYSLPAATSSQAQTSSQVRRPSLVQSISNYLFPPKQ